MDDCSLFIIAPMCICLLNSEVEHLSIYLLALRFSLACLYPLLFLLLCCFFLIES